MANLKERVLGVVGVSIATSLAIEGAFGEHPDNKMRKAPINNYKHLWVNVATLLRNIYNSIIKEQRADVTADDLLEFLLYEMGVIDGYVRERTSDTVTVIFYRNKYDEIRKYLPNVELRQITADSQLILMHLRNSVLDAMPKLLQEGINYREYDVSIKGTSTALMLTHNPIDLLSHYNFSRLDLLESHTGKIKPKNRWNTKLGSKLGENMPFNGFTIQIFGDGGDIVEMASLKARKTVVELAEKRKWSAVTTLASITQAVDTVKDEEVRELLKKYLVVRSFTA